MPVNNNPVFAITPKTPFAECTASYTDRTGATAGLVTLFTAGTNGSKITQIGAKYQGNATAGTLLIFITDTAGANPRLFDEIVITTLSATTTVPSYRNVNVYSDLNLASGQLIQVGCTVISGSINVNAFAIGGDF